MNSPGTVHRIRLKPGADAGAPWEDDPTESILSHTIRRQQNDISIVSHSEGSGSGSAPSLKRGAVSRPRWCLSSGQCSGGLLLSPGYRLAPDQFVDHLRRHGAKIGLLPNSLERHGLSRKVVRKRTLMPSQRV